MRRGLKKNVDIASHQTRRTDASARPGTKHRDVATNRAGLTDSGKLPRYLRQITGG